jgi:hypothetical protein
MPGAEWVAGVACASASDCWAVGFKGTGIGLVVATANRASRHGLD